MNIDLYISFVMAAGFLAILPGPGVLFVLSQTVTGGKRAGVSASVGTGFGGMFHVLAGAIGFSALVYSSALAFEVIKIFGALYLFFLGLKVLKDGDHVTSESSQKLNLKVRSFKQGVVTETLNPKTAMFFLALIPQFIDPNIDVAVQFALLGATSVVLNTLVDLLVVSVAGVLVNKLYRSRKFEHWTRSLSSVGYFALGFLALKSTRD